MNNVSYPAAFNSTDIVGRIPATFWPEWSSRVMFENKGIDVEIAAECLGDSDTFTIEIKPTVGDDYPTVLRQMLAGKVRYLFLEKYTGTGATLDQFLSIFAASGRSVIFKHDVDDQHQRLLRSMNPEQDDNWDDFPVSFDFDSD